MKSKKAFCAVIALAIIISAFLASCSAGDDNRPSDKTPAENAGGTDAEKADEPEDAVDSAIGERSKIPDGVEDEDMNGMEVRICVRSNWYQAELFIEEETGEPVNDAIYSRNIKVEDRFNIKLEKRLADAPSQVGLKIVQAGLDDYDLVADHMVNMGTASLKKPFLNWLDIPTIDLSKQWFPADMLKEMTVNDVLYVLAGDYCHTLVYLTNCMFFNKKLVRDYGLEDPYKIVLDGEWTIDRLNAITKDLYKDLDGDGRATKEDFYGFASDYNTGAVNYTYSSGMRIMRKAEGKVEYDLPNEKTYANFQKIYELFNNQGTHAGNWGEETELFKKKQAIFINYFFDFAKALRDFEEDFGIIPYPKFDGAQQGYLTTFNGAVTLLGVPITAKEPDRIGKIVNVLNAESWKTVVPQYYDIGMKVKFTRDDESVRIMDMILEGRVFDLGGVYDDFGNGYIYYLQTLMSKNNDGIAAYFEKQQGRAEKHIATINEAFFG